MYSSLRFGVMPMPDQGHPVSAGASERKVARTPSDVSRLLSVLYNETVADIADEYDEDETPLPVDLELEVEITVHDREPEVDGDE